MMSVHNERTFSQKIFQSLHDIACTAACHIGQCHVTRTVFNITSAQHGNLSFDSQWETETSSLKCGSPVWPTWLWCWWTWGQLSSPFSHLKTFSLRSPKAICCKCPFVHSSRHCCWNAALQLCSIVLRLFFFCTGVKHPSTVRVVVSRNRETSLKQTTTTSWRWDTVQSKTWCQVSPPVFLTILRCCRQYLGLCLTLCPRAYSDDELLLLLTVLGKVSLDSNLILQTGMELDSLLCRIFYNIKEWDAMVGQHLCSATDLISRQSSTD